MQEGSDVSSKGLAKRTVCLYRDPCFGSLHRVQLLALIGFQGKQPPFDVNPQKCQQNICRLAQNIYS